jgi:hypothetical protein
MHPRFRLPVAALAILVAFSWAPLRAEYVTATGSLVKKDKFHSENLWGQGLVLPREGRIVRVMYGTYGFAIKDASGRRIADFLEPQQAVGMSLAPGSYVIEPYVCAKHRHHHVEVTVEY